MKFKGPVFPSYKEPPSPSSTPRELPDRALPPGKSWLSHTGNRARLRNLRTAVKPILDDKSPEMTAALVKLRESVKNDPMPEYAFLHILFSAKEAAEGAGVTPLQSIEYMLQKWEEVAEKYSAEQEAHP